MGLNSNKMRIQGGPSGPETEVGYSQLYVFDPCPPIFILFTPPIRLQWEHISLTLKTKHVFILHLLGDWELGIYTILIWVVVTQEIMYVRMCWIVHLMLVHFIQFVYMCFTSVGKKKPSLKFLDSFYPCPKLAQEWPWPSPPDVYYGNTLKVGLSELSIICQCFSVF